MEVKQISQGLILHYPLNRNGWGQENLLINSNTERTSKNTYIYWPFTEDDISKISGNVCTISFDAKSTTNNVACDVYFRSNNKMVGSSIIVSNITTKYKRYSVTMTAPTSTFVSICIRNNGNVSGASKTATYSYKNIKVELGQKATPWCPHEADELYNQLGINNNIQYDTSGYKNNGVKIGTFTYNSDTPKYNTSTYAQGSTSTYLEGIVLPSEAKTVSLWIKCAKTANSAIFNDRITGLQIGLINSLLYVNSLASTKGFTTTHWKNNEWNHVVVINNNGTRFCYVNGQAETQSGSSNYYIHNTDKFWLWNRSYDNNYPFKGNLSDLRIYCTALSLEDILLLYHNSVYIDNQGNIYGAMYEEV